ncbi:MAG: Imm49 family immunity protein [bacterium]
MKLEEYGEPLAYEIAFWMQGLTNPEYPVEELGRLSLELSDKFRALAIIVLLVKGDSDLFYHNLIRSGRARLIYLQRLKSEGIGQDHHQASGRYEPLLDAIAAGDFELAHRIIELSPAEWQKGHEYEDDYCYAQVLHRLVQEPVPEQEIPPLFKQFEAYLEGQPSARLDVCRAIVEQDQPAFDEAFADLLDDREAQIAANKARGQLEEPSVVAQRQVFIEGLALLRLAGRRGLATQPDYRYCPSLARIPMKTPFPGE